MSSLTVAVIKPLTKELYPRLLQQLKSQILCDLKAPMLEQLAPLLQEALLQYILGDDFEDFQQSAMRTAAASISVPKQEPLPPSLSVPVPSLKWPRFEDIQVVEGVCAHPDPLQALPSIWSKDMLAKKSGAPTPANRGREQPRAVKPLGGKGREFVEMGGENEYGK
ncbi:hypothetical protein ACG7TL_002359 [Trametes sanguinea]